MYMICESYNECIHKAHCSHGKKHRAKKFCSYVCPVNKAKCIKHIEIDKQIEKIIKNEIGSITIMNCHYDVYFGERGVVLIDHRSGHVATSDTMPNEPRYRLAPAVYRLAIDKAHKIERARIIYKRGENND